MCANPPGEVWIRWVGCSNTLDVMWHPWFCKNFYWGGGDRVKYIRNISVFFYYDCMWIYSHLKKNFYNKHWGSLDKGEESVFANLWVMAILLPACQEPPWISRHVTLFEQHRHYYCNIMMLKLLWLDLGVACLVATYLGAEIRPGKGTGFWADLNSTAFPWSVLLFWAGPTESPKVWNSVWDKNILSALTANWKAI